MGQWAIYSVLGLSLTHITYMIEIDGLTHVITFINYCFIFVYCELHNSI